MAWLNNIRARAISVMVFQAGGCRGCALQFAMALSQNTSIRGITVTENPKHTDVLFVTGSVNDKSKEELKNIYEQMPFPKAVIAAGACSCSGSLFHSNNNNIYLAEEIIPVDFWVRGCMPGPEEMLGAVGLAMESVCEDKESGGQNGQEME